MLVIVTWVRGAIFCAAVVVAAVSAAVVVVFVAAVVVLSLQVDNAYAYG